MPDVTYQLISGNFSRLAEETGYHRTHISKALRGKCGCSDEFLKAIADAVGCWSRDVRLHIERVNK